MKFLQILKQNYSKKNISKYFILCNSSCDMDSFLSSIILSLARNINENTLKFNGEFVEINPDFKKLYIPLLNCKKGELKFRLDINYVLKKFDIDENNFLYLDEEIDNLTKNNYDKIILVDHNELDNDLSFLSDQVEEIYDHHKINNLNNYKNLKSIFIKFPLGSCSTLILAEYYISFNYLNEVFQEFINPLFLISALLLDTNKFNKQFYLNRWIDLDYYVYQKIIESNHEISNQINDYYIKLESSKYDEDLNLEIGLENLLNKDKKLFKMANFNLHWSSIPINLKSLIKKYKWEDIVNYLEKNEESEKFDFYIIISSYSKNEENKFNKIIIIYDSKMIFKDDSKLEYLKEFLKENLNEKLNSIQKKKNYEENKIIKIMVDNTISRKSFEPILRRYLENFK